MPGSTVGDATPAAGARPLAEVYRRFAEADAAGTSPLHERVAVALSGSEAALDALGALPARQRRPPVVLAALHDLALAGRVPALAAAYAARNGDAAARAAGDAVVGMTGALAAVAGRRPPETFGTARCAVLYPAVAEAARRVGAGAVGLVDIGGSPGLNAHVDRVGIAYSDGRTLGDPSSPVHLSSSVVGGHPVPELAVPEVVARIVVGRDPLDVTDPDDVRWLLACTPPDQPERLTSLRTQLALAAATPPLLLRGDVVELLADALARVPAHALPVVTTTWALSRLPVEARRRFLHRLAEAAAGRVVAWVSVEGVGVAPGIPTFGDRPASGHSIIGLTVADGSDLHAEALGRCWSRGRLLAWLADA